MLLLKFLLEAWRFINTNLVPKLKQPYYPTNNNWGGQDFIDVIVATDSNLFKGIFVAHYFLK